ncbi:MAG: hypothetical protein HGA90_05605, partial [Alphaproteobacteria bacterium]|nr:hypothetical protein [Alphaproteobacteria bacterium]
KTVTALLQATLDSFYTNLGLSQKALELASTLAKGLDVNNPARSALAEKLQKIVQLDVLKACPACQDKGNEKEGQNKTNLSAEEREKVKTMRGFMKRVETMAQLPIVVAASPQLFVQAQEFGSMCGEGGDEDIQLAQTPSTRPPRTPPQKERASED